MKLASFCLAALFLAGCSKNIDTPEAVKQGVLKDIAKKVDIQSMEVNVDSVSFRDKDADAKVSFRPKGADSSQSIVMNYALERQGDEWRIKGRTMQGVQNPDQLGHGQPAPGQTPLPPGHPAPGGGANGAPLPPGHPQVDRNRKP